MLTFIFQCILEVIVNSKEMSTFSFAMFLEHVPYASFLMKELQYRHTFIFVGYKFVCFYNVNISENYSQNEIWSFLNTFKKNVRELSFKKITVFIDNHIICQLFFNFANYATLEIWIVYHSIIQFQIITKHIIYYF